MSPRGFSSPASVSETNCAPAPPGLPHCRPCSSYANDESGSVHYPELDLSGLDFDSEEELGFLTSHDGTSIPGAEHGALEIPLPTMVLHSIFSPGTIENRHKQNRTEMRTDNVLDDANTVTHQALVEEKENSTQAATTDARANLENIKVPCQAHTAKKSKAISPFEVDAALRCLILSPLTDKQSDDVNNGVTGCVYIFKNMSLSDNWRKIGTTNASPEERKHKLEKDCGATFQCHWDRSGLPAAMRAEKLCHKHLAYFNRPYPCRNCKNGKGKATVHREFFEVGLDTMIAYADLWSDFIAKRPYDTAGTLKQFWVDRLSNVPRPSRQDDHEDHGEQLQRWRTFVDAPESARKVWELSNHVDDHSPPRTRQTSVVQESIAPRSLQRSSRRDMHHSKHQRTRKTRQFSGIQQAKPPSTNKANGHHHLQIQILSSAFEGDEAEPNDLSLSYQPGNAQSPAQFDDGISLCIQAWVGKEDLQRVLSLLLGFIFVVNILAPYGVHAGIYLLLGAFWQAHSFIGCTAQESRRQQEGASLPLRSIFSRRIDLMQKSWFDVSCLAESQ